MATTAQIQKLRRKIQDTYSKVDGTELTASQQAFKDEELEDILDDAFAEVTEGARGAGDATAHDEAMAMLLARADAILQITQDEARRIRWETANEIQDPSDVARNLVSVARALQNRYENYRKRQQERDIEGINNRPTGGRMDFNSTIKRHYERNFDNRTVRRNTSPDH